MLVLASVRYPYFLLFLSVYLNISARYSLFSILKVFNEKYFYFVFMLYIQIPVGLPQVLYLGEKLGT
jgi:hypothetical protein